jgi:Ser/Thr protein kinase RdoA (MazF antagonist)
MTNFDTLPPEEQARRYQDLAVEALRRWGIEGAALSLIKMRENAVFRVETADGPRALRIHRYAYHTDEALQSELQWMRALEQAGVDVPQIIPSSAGALFERVRHDAVPQERQVDLFHWINGTPLGSSGEGLAMERAAIRETFRTVGELCARVHNQSATWQPPAGFTRHAWDEDGLAGEEPLWGRFWELALLTPAERSLMERARKRVYEDLRALGKKTGYSVIHADLTPENILVHDGRLRLIDFDDAGWGWHLFELATALYFHMTEDYYGDALAAIIEGYREARPLSDADVDRLPLFMLARGLTYVGWVHTREGTETARDLGRTLVDMACQAADAYLP